MKKNVKVRAVLCLAAGMISLLAMAVPGTAFAAEAWERENGQYVDASGIPIAGALEKGITVTKYQNRENSSNGGIDWKKVAQDGISFAMVRIGYFNDRDPYYSINITGAAEAGLKTGVFFYTQALDTRTAVEEAKYVLRMVKDFQISYPIAYDVESQRLLDNNLTKQQITDNINAFCKTISEAGYRPVVYANNQWLTEHIDVSQIPYDVWYARYGTVNNYQNRTIWQCTDQGKVDGISGNVTLEFSFADYNTLIPSAGWKRIDGNWYYTKNYVKQTGWVEAEGKWYYLDSNGIMIHDTTMEIDGAAYTFGLDGAMAE
jgi:GH25 family lysozyme M1 (1,4-beta-N-acetylmuramidase)